MNDDLRLGLIIGGAAILILAILWRTVVRRRERRRLIRQLRNSDPQTRARGAIGLVDLGLLRGSRPLLRRLPREDDARVRLAAALAVARRQWEPSNASRVRALRSWASAELERQGQAVEAFGPALTRISDMGGPRPTDLDPGAAVPATGTSPAPAAQPADAEIHWHPDGPTSHP